MSTLEMDPVFTAALREALIVNAGPAPRTERRLRWRFGVGVLVSLTLAGGGVALATGLFSQPGAPIDTQLGNIVVATRTGTAMIDVGAPPTGATDISLTLTCLTAGSFNFPNGSAMTCDAVDLSKPSDERSASEIVPVSPGVDTLTIETSSNAVWTLRAVYVNQVSTAWGVNTNGQTYGVSNLKGTPDLISVVIDDGTKYGYVSKVDLNCASGGQVKSPAEALEWDKVSQNRNVSIPVYESDGVTVIGTFTVGDANGTNAATVPLSSLSLGC
jgi:hypothetical protein